MTNKKELAYNGLIIIISAIIVISIVLSCLFRADRFYQQSVFRCQWERLAISQRVHHARIWGDPKGFQDLEWLP